MAQKAIRFKITRRMHKVYKIFVFSFILTLTALVSYSQEKTDTSITSIDAELINIFNQKTPKKYKINSIKIIGNKYFDENLLLSIAGISVGDELTIPGTDAFSKSIRKLMNQNYFNDVKIYFTGLHGNKLDVEIEVTERPRLSDFHFINARKSESEDLSGKTGLVKGRVITENMKRSAVEAIKKYYFDKGFQNINVNIEEFKNASLDNNSISLNFVINKGIKVKISDIRFAGNTVETSILKKQLKGTKEQSRLTLFPAVDTGGIIKVKPYTFMDYLADRGYLTPSKTRKLLDPYVRFKLFTSAKFNQKKYEEDKDKLIEYYNSIGYRDAIIEKDLVYPNSKKNLNIDIKLNEGHKYYFGNITWRGNTKYSDSVLSLILGIKKGDVYNIETLNKRLGKGSPEGGDVGSYYMDDGYLFFRTDPVETAVYNDTIDYEIRIIEGPQATWKNIRISGNEKTKDYVIRRELRTLPGEKFSRELLIRSQRELSQLNFFNAEKINPNVVPNPDDGTVDVTWQVEEKSSDQLELSAGWGGTIGLTGTVGISFNNFSLRNLFSRSSYHPFQIPMGDGQKLSFRVQSNGRAFRSYNFSFTEPWLGGKKRNALSVSIYDTKFANAYDPATGTYTATAANKSYLKTTGFSIGLSKQLKWPDDYFALSTSLGFTQYHLVNYYISPVTLPGFNNGFSNNLNFKIALQRTSINQPLFPSSGSNFLLSLQLTPPYSLIDKGFIEQANPYKWIEYHKWRFNGEWYIPLTKPSGAEHNKMLVLKLAAKYGFLGRYNLQLQVSPFERFQVGDAGLSNQYALIGYDIISHRGYPVYNTPNVKVNPDQSGTNQYFTMFNKYTLELRYPLSLNPSSTIYALTFFEAANGWYNLKTYNPFELRRSVGIGMRFYLPMFGLLGFDYGIGLDRYTPGGSLKDMSRFTFMLGYEPE